MRFLTGRKAKKHFNEIMEHHGSAPYKHPTDTDVQGGYWRSKAEEISEDEQVWIAFDNSTNDCNVEEFANEIEAAKFAQGIEATTLQGHRI